MTPNQCYKCKNYMGMNTCLAFKKIPKKIITGEFNHSNPYPNAEKPTDNGIRFEKIKGK